MSSEKVEVLRVLVNQKMKLEKFHAFYEGLQNVSFIMLIFYVFTYKSSNLPYLISWSFLAFISWVISHITEKKILLVKKSISEGLFERDD